MVSSVSNSSISQLFARLDTGNQDYLSKSDFSSALSGIGSGSDSTSVDQLFSTLDTDGDGKVTESEFSSTLAKLQDELSSQFHHSRMHGGHGAQGAGGPPPPPADDAGFTQDELQSQLDQIGGTDSQRAGFISNIVSNFSAADTNGDGKVSFAEARAYNQSSSTGSSGSTDGSNSSGSTASNDAQVLRQIAELLHTYGNSDQSGLGLLNSDALSTSA